MSGLQFKRDMLQYRALDLGGRLVAAVVKVLARWERERL
jgi:hypothetical protein